MPTKHTTDRVSMLKTKKGQPFKNKPGAGCPEKLDEEKLKLMSSLAAIHCSYPEIAAGVGIDESSLYRNEKYKSIIEKGRENGKMRLRRAMFKSALGGNVVMQIWLSKQLLGYSEKTVYDPSGNVSVTLKYKLPEIETTEYVEHERVKEIESTN